MLRLIIVRHGTTKYNDENRMQGRSNIGLNAEGIKQAKKLAKRFGKDKIDIIFSSEMVRAKHTANHIAKATKAKISTDANFNEIDFGVFDGKSLDEIKKDPLLNNLWEKRLKDRYKFRIPMGESYADVETRVLSSLRRILDLYDNHTVMIATHGIVMRVIVKNLLKLSLERVMRDHKFDNGSVFIFEIEKGKIRSVSLGDTSHLKSRV